MSEGVDYQGLANELRRAYVLEHKLYLVHCDLLYQCDLDCEHCYLDHKATRNLPTSFWLDLVDQMAAMGVFKVLFSGGELFLRPDALEILRYASESGLILHLKSHGGTLDDSLIEALSTLRISRIDLSYYSCIPEHHDAITRRPGSHSATLRALKSLSAAGLPAHASIVVMGKNAGEVLDTIAQCEAIGVTSSITSALREAQSGDDFPLDSTLNLPARAALERALRGGTSGCDLPDDQRWGETDLCIAGHGALYISPEGQVTPCVTWMQSLGSLAQGARLDDLWTGSPILDEIRTYQNRNRETCGGCELKGDCSYCPGKAHLATADPLAGSDTLCDQAIVNHVGRTGGSLDHAPSPARRRNPFRIVSVPPGL